MVRLAGRWTPPVIDNRPTRRRASARSATRWLGLAAALAFHLALVMAVTFDLRDSLTLPMPFGERPAQAVDIDLTPPPKPAAQPERRMRAPLPSASPRPSQPSPAPAQGPAAPAPTVTAAAPPASEGAPGVTSALRASLGCDHASFLELSEAEKLHCRQRMVGRSQDAPERDIGINPEARAEFDLAWKEDHSPQHLAFVGCFARFGVGKLIWYHPSRGVKLGPLPCYYGTPKSTLLPDKPAPTGF
jgi:hypothetical protein